MSRAQPLEHVSVLLWCQHCEAESYGTAPAYRTHDVLAYVLPVPWRLVVVEGRRSPLNFLACSDACEAKVRA